MRTGPSPSCTAWLQSRSSSPFLGASHQGWSASICTQTEHGRASFRAPVQMTTNNEVEVDYCRESMYELEDTSAALAAARAQDEPPGMSGASGTPGRVQETGQPRSASSCPPRNPEQPRVPETRRLPMTHTPDAPQFKLPPFLWRRRSPAEGSPRKRLPTTHDAANYATDASNYRAHRRPRTTRRPGQATAARASPFGSDHPVSLTHSTGPTCSSGCD